MAESSISEIAEVIGARPILADDNTIIRELLYDSRRFRMAAHCLFFALRGKNHDGHHYIPELIRKGVRNFVMEELPQEEHDEGNFLIVPDAMEALQKLAAEVRKNSGARIIAITGSNGKTIVKEWLGQMLERQFKVCRNPKSYNSQVGVPLSVWALQPDDEIGVFEAGISMPNEMEKLENILKPEWGIFTNIGSAHEENFENRQQKIREKLKLFISSEILFYRKDGSMLAREIEAFARANNVQLRSWSAKDTGADLYLNKTEAFDGGTHYEGMYRGRGVQMAIPFTDPASRENAIHCWLVLLEKRLSPDLISEAFKKLEPVEMRLEMKAGINGTLLLNDAYNSDIESLRIALEYLEVQVKNRQKILILSDIHQSGLSQPELYEQVSKILQRHNLNRIIAIGPDLKEYGLQTEAVVDHYPDTETFVQHIFRYRFKDHALLLKGARQFHFEEISRYLEQKTHETVLEIHLHRMVHNLNYFRSRLLPDVKVMAMVKAFSYGSGSYEIANLLEFHKVDYLAVAYTDEGIELRKEGISLPILVLNPEISAFEGMIAYKLEPEIYSFRQLEAFRHILRQIGYNGLYPIHLKLETGMHRLGFEKDELPGLVDVLKNDKQLRIASVFSHLAASEDPAERDFTLGQISALREMSHFLKEQLDIHFLTHILNSGGISHYPEGQFDMVRLGIGLYGITTHKEEMAHLRIVSELKATVSQVKNLKPGESVGYGRSFVADRDMKIAVISIGYADGMRRNLSNGRGEVVIRGRRHKVVGRVCMDVAMVDVTGSDVREGEEVEIFGSELSIHELAEKMKTIPYEVLTGISQRVKRVYFME